VTGVSFEDGALYASLLLVDEKGVMQRYDFLAEKEDEFAPPAGEILCRWRQAYRKEPEKNEALRRQRETAEGLFLSLFEIPAGAEETPGGEAGAEESSGPVEETPDGAEAEILKKFLGLLLERKKIIRPRGLSPDGRFRIVEHARSKNIFLIPAGELTPDEFMSISERLSELVR